MVCFAALGALLDEEINVGFAAICDLNIWGRMGVARKSYISEHDWPKLALQSIF